MCKKEMFYNFEYLRIVLICAVIIHHFFHKITGIWNSGGNAVEYFFVISGFVFAYTFKPEKSIIEFAVSKLVRFLPLLSISAIIVAICTSFNIQKLFADIFLLPLTGLYDKFGYNSPDWYIAVLFWILIFYFALLKISPSSTHKSVANLIIGILTFCALSALNLSNLPNWLRIIRGIGSFGVGYFAYQICSYFPRNNDNKKSKIYTLIEFIGILYFTIFPYTCYKITNKTAMIFEMGIILILLYLKKGYISSLLEKTIFSKFSRYVLPIYLTHVILYVPVLNPILKYYKNIISAHPYVFSIIGVILAWILGIFAYHFIQNPIEKYLTNNVLVPLSQNIKSGEIKNKQ